MRCYPGQLLTRLHQTNTNTHNDLSNNTSEMVDEDGQEVVSFLNQPGSMMDQGKHQLFLASVGL